MPLYSLLTSLILHGLILLGPFSEKNSHNVIFSSKKSSFKISFNEVKKIKKIKKKRKLKKSNKRKTKVPREAIKDRSATIDNAVTSSKVLKKTIPKYPYKSRKYHEEGIVLLKVFISSDGKALKIEIIQSSSFDRLDRSAIAAAMSSEYVSSSKNGVLGESYLELEFKFELSN